MPNWIDSHDGFDIEWNEPPERHYAWPSPPVRPFLCVESLGMGFHCWSKDCKTHNYRVRRKWRNRAVGSIPNSKAKLWAVTLPVGKYLPQPKLSDVRQDFNRRMRRGGFAFEYFWVLHYDHGLLNLHLLVKTKTDLAVERIEKAWRGSMWFRAERRDLKNMFYCEPCYSPVGYVGYSSQTSTDEDSMDRVPPRGWYRNLFGITKGFAALWNSSDKKNNQRTFLKIPKRFGAPKCGTPYSSASFSSCFKSAVKMTRDVRVDRIKPIVQTDLNK